MSEEYKRAYLCDGYGCDEKCAEKTKEEWAKHNCHHTIDEKHARNKIRRERKWAMCEDGKMLEVERGKKRSLSMINGASHVSIGSKTR